MINNVSETVKETSNPSEDMEKSQQILQEKPVEQDELMEKFDTLQQALTTLQKTFDDSTKMNSLIICIVSLFVIRMGHWIRLLI